MVHLENVWTAAGSGVGIDVPVVGGDEGRVVAVGVRKPSLSQSLECMLKEPSEFH